jgi:hypothetical protein
MGVPLVGLTTPAMPHCGQSVVKHGGVGEIELTILQESGAEQ